VCVLERERERERSCGGAAPRERERDYSKVTAILLGMPATSLAATLRAHQHKSGFSCASEFHLRRGAYVSVRRNCATRFD